MFFENIRADLCRPHAFAHERVGFIAARFAAAHDGLLILAGEYRRARRRLIPYIDIGMDVHDLGKQGYLVSGQVILSMPGAPCMRCCGFITDERREQEARKYGAAGAHPQVVWSKGVLASTAVGLRVSVPRRLRG